MPRHPKTRNSASAHERRPQRIVIRLREQLWTMVRIATYVCAHHYGPNTPAGTRVDAIEDLRARTRETIDLLTKTENGQALRSVPKAGVEREGKHE